MRTSSLLPSLSRSLADWIWETEDDKILFIITKNNKHKYEEKRLWKTIYRGGWVETTVPHPGGKHDKRRHRCDPWGRGMDTLT